MSAEHVGWAFRQKRLTPTCKLVLVALADRCNKDTLRCDPSIKKIGEDTGLARMTIFRALETLEESGFIAKVTRKRENGSDTSNEYRFPGITMVRGESHSDTPPSLTVIPPEPELLEPELEPTSFAKPPNEQKLRPRNAVWDALSELFGEPITRPAQKERGEVCRDLTEAGATADEIFGRAKRWAMHFDHATLTDHALVKHWHTLPLQPRRIPR